jgi:predicted nuclease of restriction endonuclease-like RecB superfamily
MLTSELLRYKIDDDTITPRYLTRQHADYYLKIAQKLIGIFQRHVGKTRGELEAALDTFEGGRVGYKIVRGLAKILEGFAEFTPNQEMDYPALRLRLFEYVEQYRPVVRTADLVHQHTKQKVIQKFTSEVGPLPQNLYGDLPEYQILVKMKRKVEPEELIRRYNLALAQGLLYRCYHLEVRIWDSYKTVFHYLKLAQLMHKIQKVGEAYRIIVDGPFSLFRRTQKYGVNLARFLPGLILATKWQMRAEINTEEGRRVFRLDQNCGLHSYYMKDHPFDSRVEEAFYRQFEKRKTDWQIHREGEILDLGDTVLIPDFSFTHPDGRSALLEIVGFWTP